jgi:hypothetical protein
MATASITLTEDIARSLRTALGGSGNVSCPDGKITVVLSRTDCEKNYGQVLQQIHRIIAEYCPERDEHIFIRVQDEAGLFQNVLKIWKTI